MKGQQSTQNLFDSEGKIENQINIGQIIIKQDNKNRNKNFKLFSRRNKSKQINHSKAKNLNLLLNKRSMKKLDK